MKRSTQSRSCLRKPRFYSDLHGCCEPNTVLGSLLLAGPCPASGLSAWKNTVQDTSDLSRQVFVPGSKSSNPRPRRSSMAVRPSQLASGPQEGAARHDLPAARSKGGMSSKGLDGKVLFGVLAVGLAVGGLALYNHRHRAPPVMPAVKNPDFTERPAPARPRLPAPRLSARSLQTEPEPDVRSTNFTSQ